VVTHEEEVAAHAWRTIRLRDGVIESSTRRPIEPPPRAAGGLSSS
jgi:ABC-type lipoprotein export system ATPase subunit